MRRAASAVLLAGISVLAGCGGGSSDAGAGGRLNFRALWQQDGGGQPAAAAAAIAQRAPAAQSGFGPVLPASVNTIRVVFVSDSGFGCCSAVDPAQVPLDASGHADLVLSSLPGGEGTLTLAGFPTDFAPAPAGVSQICPTVPTNVASPCDASRSATPNFASQPQRVLIVPGEDNNAGDILIFAVGTATPTALPASTPTATATPVTGPCAAIGAPVPPPSGNAAPETAVVSPGEDIAAAAKRLPAGSTLVVSPGEYGPVVLGPGDLQDGITLFGDETGAFSDGVPAPVTITARGRSAAIKLTGQSDVIIDGFQLRGGRGAGILVQSSSGITVRNCVVTGTRGDGIRVEQTDQSLVFNNLTADNTGTGIRLSCTSGLRVINNTVYGNDDSGIVLGQSQPSVVENNIIDTNSPVGIAADAGSTGGYQGDFNLNTDDYGAGTPIGANDINTTNSPGGTGDPFFIAPRLGDFHLQKGLAGSTSPAINAGAPDTDPDLVNQLSLRTTQTDSALDTPPVDLGYHYLAIITPSPTPKPPRTPTPT